MTRVQCSTLGWGVIQDAHGNIRTARPFTLTDLDGASASLYANDTGATTTPKVTNSRGEIPGWVESGSYLLTVDDHPQVRVEAPVGLTDLARRPLGFHAGGFVRTQPTPIMDRAAEGETFHDPGIYAEDHGANRHFWLYGSCRDSTSFDVSTGWVGLATAVVPIGTEPTDADFTYQGPVIEPSDVPAAETGGDQVGFVGASVVLKIDDTYHQWVVAVADDWSNVVGGWTAHFTAPDPAGPWTYQDIATEPITGELTTHDNCVPVEWDGQLVMAVKSLHVAAPSNFTLRLYTGPLDGNGPWTRADLPTVYGGYNTLTSPAGLVGELQVDSPMLFADGGRLFLGGVTLGWFTALYEVSRDLSELRYIGPVLQIPDSTGAASSEESGAAQFGAGGWFRIGDEVYYPYATVPRPTAGSYGRVMLSKWHPGRDIYVPYQLVADSVLANNASLASNASATLSIPDSIPYEAVALEILLTAFETSAVGATRNVAVYSGDSLDASISVFPQVLNFRMTARGRIRFKPDGNPRTITVKSNNGAVVTYTVLITGYWRLP